MSLILGTTKKMNEVTDEELIQILKHGRCKCSNIALEPHPCPYSEELYDDASECNCCANCINQCSDDI